MTPTRFPIPVSYSRAPLVLHRGRMLLVMLTIYAAGFFTGAILFGELLLSLHSS